MFFLIWGSFFPSKMVNTKPSFTIKFECISGKGTWRSKNNLFHQFVLDIWCLFKKIISYSKQIQGKKSVDISTFLFRMLQNTLREYRVLLFNHSLAFFFYFKPSFWPNLRLFIPNIALVLLYQKEMVLKLRGKEPKVKKTSIFLFNGYCGQSYED